MTSVEKRKIPELNISIPVFDDADAKPNLFPRYRKKRSSDGETESDRTHAPNWRGHGGRHPTYSSVEFDRQLDKISLWLESWDHSQVKRKILKICDFDLINCTVYFNDFINLLTLIKIKRPRCIIHVPFEI